MRCSMLQFVAVYCDVLQSVAMQVLVVVWCECVTCFAWGWGGRGLEARCNTLQQTATHCNTLQHTATHCNTLQHTHSEARSRILDTSFDSYIHYNTLQHTATHCNILQYTVTHCTTLQQHTATNFLCVACCCNTLQHIETHNNTQQPIATKCNTLQHTATHYNTLQLTAKHCYVVSRQSSTCIHTRNTLQHIATGCNALQHTPVYTLACSCNHVFTRLCTNVLHTGSWGGTCHFSSRSGKIDCLCYYVWCLCVAVY